MAIFMLLLNRFSSKQKAIFNDGIKRGIFSNLLHNVFSKLIVNYSGWDADSHV